MPTVPSAWAMTILAGAVGDFDGLGHLLFAEFLDVEVGDGVHDAAGGHELDPVGAILDVAAHDVVDVVDGVGDVLAAGKLQVGREGSAVAVAAGDGDAAAGGGDAGAEDDAALDGVAQGELRVVGRTFAGVADGGESVIEPEAQVVDAPERGLRNGGAQVGGEVLRGGVGEDVAVGVDEAGEHGVVGQIGDGDAAWGGIGDGLDAVAGDEDVGVGAHGAGADVDELAGEDRLCDGLGGGGARGWRGGLGLCGERWGETEGGEEAGGSACHLVLKVSRGGVREEIDPSLWGTCLRASGFP